MTPMDIDEEYPEEDSEKADSDEDLGDTTFKTFEKDPKATVRLKEKMIETMGKSGEKKLADAKNAMYWKTLALVLSKIIVSEKVDLVFQEILRIKKFTYKTRRGFILKLVKKYEKSNLDSILKLGVLKNIYLLNQASGKSYFYWKRACNLLAYFCIVDYDLRFVSESTNYLLKESRVYRHLGSTKLKLCSTILSGLTNTHRMMARAKVIEEKQRIIDLY